MFGLDMLDVAIGLIFVYLMLSLVSSAAAEAVERFLKYRASDLEKGIGELLRKPELVKELYDHPLIKGLFVGSYDDAKKSGNLPSYIPAQSFALALMDLVFPTRKQTDSGAKGAMAPGTSQILTHPNLDHLRTKVTDAAADAAAPATKAVPAAASAAAAANAAAPGANVPPPPPAPHELEHVDADVARALVCLIDAAQRDATKARENIETWFNTSMDRVSGWYKRRTQTFLMVLGLVLAVVLNADSIEVVRKLSINKSARDAIVGQATAVAQKGMPQEGTLDQALEQLKQYQLPIGWQGYGCSMCAKPKTPPALSDKLTDHCWLGCWLIKLLGWIMTAGAISLGAPFWFDTLNKFIVVRSTIKPNEKSPNEKPKG